MGDKGDKTARDEPEVSAVPGRTHDDPRAEGVQGLGNSGEGEECSPH